METTIVTLRCAKLVNAIHFLSLAMWAAGAPGERVVKHDRPPFPHTFLKSGNGKVTVKINTQLDNGSAPLSQTNQCAGRF